MSSVAVIAESVQPISEIRLVRQTGTYADVLAAVGLAELLHHATGDRRVRIVDEGAAFRVVLPSPLPSSLRVPHAAGYPFVRPKPAAAVPSSVRPADVLDYQQTKTEVDALRAQERALYEAARKAGRPVDQEALAQVREQWPARVSREVWRRVVALLVLQGHETANRIHAAIVQMAPGAFQATVQQALQRLAAGSPTGVR